MSLADLAALAARHASGSDYVRPLGKLGILRQPRPTSFDAALYEPVFIVVLEGRKETVLAGESYSMGPGECLLASHDLPIVARITRAPYAAAIFDIDLRVLRELHASIGQSLPPIAHARSLTVERCDDTLISALGRYLGLAGEPLDSEVLAPLLEREIHYRLVTASFGGMLRNLLRRDSHESAISRALGKLRRDFRSPLEIPALARSVGMSTSSFHKHFKAITASSPLQYRKNLQLLDARRRLRSGSMSVSAVAFEVGYESAAQFSRDYSRKFGVSPKHDVRRDA